jgi:hypothetical protein
MIGGIIKKQIK